MSGNEIQMTPIGYVTSSRAVPEDDNWDAESSSITLVDEFTEKSVLGLADFSHVLVVYVLDKATWNPERQSRHPRGNPEWPEVGIFAQRAKDRPNKIGATICEVISVEGTTIRVKGLDAIDGTPVIDIKPHMVEYGARGEVRQPEWSTELMKDYF
jgi:tRNA-Thr(GGU) m(6)t(6)A37 methyltransferase TsaA